MNYKQILYDVQEQLSLEKTEAEFLVLNLDSLKTIAKQAQAIVDILENDSVKKDLTQSWLQVKIGETQEHVSVLHDFLKYDPSEDDNNSYAKDKPGLWENIRRKKEREGKKYKPAKPGDKDRPDKKQWDKLSK